MPLGLDPTRRVSVWLDSDADVPEPTRPTFFAHFLTCQEAIEYEQILVDARELTANKDVDAKLNEAMALALIGWKNINGRDGKPIPFDPAQFSAVLTPMEKWHLVYAIRTRITLEESELGKSSSQRTSDGASTVVTAAAPPLSAPTSPAPSAQS